MDCIKLQQALANLVHLLPLQQDWFERLLFQLSFNDIETIQTLGAAGSGKSTLALALAELLSEQSNVALLSAVSEEQAITVIQQQWFGYQTDAADFTGQINQYTAEQELCLIIDDGQNYSAAFIQLLTSLSVRCFIFTTKPVVASALTLTINQAGSEDVKQLLATEGLSTEQLAQRLTRAQGNLNYLIQGIAAEKCPKFKLGQVWVTKPHNVVMFGIGIVIIFVAGFVISYQQFFANHQPKPASEQAIINAADWALVPEHNVIAIPSVKPNSTPDVVTESSAFIEHDNITGLNPDNLNVEADNDIARNSSISTAVTSEMINEATELAATAMAPVANTNQQFTQIASVAGCHESQLSAASDTGSALQLAVLSNPAAFKRFQAQYSKLAMVCYQRSWQGKTQVVVLLGPFMDNQQALGARKNLPTKLAASGSFVKSIKAVQAEITAFNISQQLSTVD